MEVWNYSKWHKKNKKQKIMTEKQQQTQIAQNLKSQKEAALLEFKQRARCTALNTSQYLNKNEATDSVLKDAEKIYKWLLNGQK